MTRELQNIAAYVIARIALAHYQGKHLKNSA